MALDIEDPRTYATSELAFLNENSEYQVNTWAIPVGSFSKGADLQSLKRRGLVDAEGRGMGRQWWITEKGKEALA